MLSLTEQVQMILSEAAPEFVWAVAQNDPLENWLPVLAVSGGWQPWGAVEMEVAVPDITLPLETRNALRVLAWECQGRFLARIAKVN